MVAPPVSVAIESVADLLGTRRRLSLPHRQRAYAWGIDQVSRLLADLLAATAKAEDARHHLLGRVLLVSEHRDGGIAQVVDGHQRLVTLTILMAVLRDLSSDPADRQRLSQAIGDGSVAGGFRLVPQVSLDRVLSTYVQTPSATLLSAEEGGQGLSESESNVLANRDYLRHRLTRAEITPQIRARLAQLVTDACWLVVMVSRNEDEAWKYLEDEETTGLDFSPTDRAKASILSDVPPEDLEACTAMWEEWQHRLGSEDTLALLNHTRALLLRRRSEAPVEVDFTKYFLGDGKELPFFRTQLAPRAETILRLRKGAAGPASVQADVAVALKNLEWIERHVWMPAMILWLETRDPDDHSIALFARRLERLVWLLRIGSFDPAVREARILAVLADLDRGVAVDAAPSLSIERSLRAAALSGLRDKGFGRRRFCVPVLKRLAVLAGDEHQAVHGQSYTIEHILPRNPSNRGAWLHAFGTRSRMSNSVNRLGNLTLLTSSENNRIGSRDYSEKREMLADAALKLARECATETDWTLDIVEARTERLIAALFKAWDLEM